MAVVCIIIILYVHRAIMLFIIIIIIIFIHILYSSHSDRLETLMCPAENGWVGAANQVVIRDCPPGYRGTRTRRCNSQGVWSPPNESGCEEVRCPAFGEWVSMLMGEVQVRVCESGGFALLTCGENGEWEGSPSVCCMYCEC